MGTPKRTCTPSEHPETLCAGGGSSRRRAEGKRSVRGEPKASGRQAERRRADGVVPMHEHQRGAGEHPAAAGVDEPEAEWRRRQDEPVAEQRWRRTSQPACDRDEDEAMGTPARRMPTSRSAPSKRGRGAVPTSVPEQSRSRGGDKPGDEPGDEPGETSPRDTSPGEASPQTGPRAKTEHVQSRMCGGCMCVRPVLGTCVRVWHVRVAWGA